MPDMTLAEVALIVRSDTSRIRPEVERSSVAAGRSGGEKLGDGLVRGVGNRISDSRGRFLAAGKSMGADMGKGLQIELGSGGGTFAKTLAVMASRLAIVGGAAGAAAPGVAQLAAALAPAAGAAVVLPAALLAIKAATGTVKIAIMGVGDAINAGFQDEPKAAAAALEKLSGATRKFAQEVIALRPQVQNLRKAVSSRFFTPLLGEVRPLGELYLPMLTARMGNLAGVMGGLGEQFLQTARKGEVMSAVSGLFDNTAIAGVRLRAAIDPIVTAFAALVRTTAPELPGIAESFANMATRVANFVKQASETGRVTAIFNNAKMTLQDLGGILRNVGSIFGSVMSSAQAGSGGLLKNVLALTDQVAKFFQSSQGSGALTSVFSTLGALGQALRTSLAAVLPAIADSIAVVGPALAGLAGPASQIVVALAPLLPFVAGFAAAVATALTPALAVLAGWLAKNETAMKVALVTIVAFTAAAKAAAFVAGVQAAGGIAAWAASTFKASAVGKAFTAVQYAIGVAMRFALGPIGLVIAAIGALVAAVVWAYKNNETFRNIVNKVWAEVRKFIGTAITTIGTVIRNVWQNVISPTLKALNSYVRNVVMPTVLWLWRNVVQPAFGAIGRIIQAAWAVIRVVFAAWVSYLKTFVFPTIRFLWEKVVQPVFNALRNHISDTWNNRIKPVFSALGNFIKNTVAPAFKTGVTAISKAWSAIRDAAKKPVEFVVNQVINPLIGGFNRIADFFKTPLIKPITGFAHGGRIPGRPSDRDNLLASGPGGRNIALATGEYIVNARSTAANLPLIDAINRARGPVVGGVQTGLDGLEGFADGGIVGFLGKVYNGIKGAADFVTNPVAGLKKVFDGAMSRIPGGGQIVKILKGMGSEVFKGVSKFIGDMFAVGGDGGSFGKWPSSPGAQRGDSGVWRKVVAMIKGSGIDQGSFGNGYRPGDPKWHGSGRAVDWMGYNMDALATWLSRRNPLELIHRTKNRDYAYTRGKNKGSFNRSLMEAHRNHIHIAMANGGLLDAKGGIPTTSADFGSTTLQRGWNMVHNGLGRPEPLADPMSGQRIEELFRELIAVTAANPSGFAKAMGGTSTGLMRQARRV